MDNTDKFLATFSMLLFVVFLGIMVWWVKEIDLTIVVLIVCAMGIYDFWLGAGQKSS